MTDTMVGTAVVVADTDTLTRDEWLDERRHGIGGSDVSAIAGLNPWRTPLAVWLEKTGIYVPDDAPSEAMEWGTLLEPVVADEFSKRSGIPTVVSRQLLAHPDHRFMRANIDRAIPHDPVEGVPTAGIYEGKTTSPWQAREWADNKIPDHAALQTHHYLLTTDLAYGYVAVLIGGQRLEWRRVERDVEIDAFLLSIESEFWKRVENQDPPPPEASDAQLLGDVWSPRPESSLVVTDELREALAAREAAKHAEKVAAEAAAEAQARIELALGDREFLVDADGRPLASWREIGEAPVAAYTRRAYRRFLAIKPKTEKGKAE